MNGATKRDFASLLDELLVDSQIEEQSAPPSTAAFDPLSVAAELLSGRIKVSDDQAAAEYRDTARKRSKRVRPTTPSSPSPRPWSVTTVAIPRARAVSAASTLVGARA